MRKSLKTRIQAGNFEAVCRMIAANAGIGLLPESAARRHEKTLPLRIIPLLDEWAVRDLQICVRNVRLQPPYARELVDTLLADGDAATG